LATLFLWRYLFTDTSIGATSQLFITFYQPKGNKPPQLMMLCNVFLIIMYLNYITFVETGIPIETSSSFGNTWALLFV
jgi:hypothetical protein